jgi:hypothetical protein
MNDRLQVSYSQGKAKVTIPQGNKARPKPVSIKLTMEQADALRLALEANPMWVGDGYWHYDWPMPERKSKKAKQQ